MKNRLARFTFRSILIISMFLLSGTATFAAEEETQKGEVRELVFLNWSEYVDPDLISQFESKFNARVKEVYFESDEDRDQMMVERDAKGFDVILMDTATIPRYTHQGWIAPLDPDKIPNLRFSDPDWLQKNARGEIMTAPYFWGTLGIAYRSDLVPEPITKWRQIFEPREELRGKIDLTEDSWDVVGSALRCLGYSGNSLDPKELAEAEALLRKQRPFIRSYSSLSTAGMEESDLVTGEISVAMMYNGDALTIQEFNEDIVFVLPEEGGYLWGDQLCLSAHSQQKELAESFIDFLNEPEISKQNAEFLWYAPANVAAMKILSPEFLEDPSVFPTPEQLQTCERYDLSSPRGVKARLLIAAKLGMLTP